MRRFLLSAATVIALCSSASAADWLEAVTPVEPAPVVKESTPSWTGAWIGVQGGLTLGDEDDGDVDLSGDWHLDDNEDDFGGEAGVAAGFDWQIGNSAFGVLGDVNGTDLDLRSDAFRQPAGVEAD